MPTLINNKVTYQGGEALPAVGSSAYVAAQNGEINPLNSSTGEIPAPSSSAITSQSLAPAVPYNIPSAKTALTTTNLSTASNSAIGGIKTDATAEPVIAPKEDAKTLRDALIKRISGQVSEEQQIRNDAGLAAKKAKALGISNELDSLDKSFRDEVQNIKSTFQGTTQGLQDKINSASDRYQNTRANIALIYKVASQDYQGAEEIVTQKINSLKEGNANDVNAYKLVADSINNDLTESEKLQVQANITRKENQAKAKEDAYAEALKNAVQNGAPASVISSIDSAAKDPKSTISSIYGAAGSYGVDKSKSVALQNAILAGEKLKNEIDAGKPVTGEYAPIINGASGLVANTKKQQVKQNISNALAGGDFKTAYAEVANAVSDGLTGTPKTKFDDARTDINIMSGMREAIKAYSDAGGDLGLLSGTEEQIKRKLGIDSGKASALATQLWREFQTYRSNMTGAAFTPAESRDYASVNPTLGKSLDLNLSVIDGALAQLNNRVTSTVNARLPDAKKIYDLANGTQNAPTAKNGDTKVYNGTTYKVINGIWTAQ